jgi:hypothetical protein
MRSDEDHSCHNPDTAPIGSAGRTPAQWHHKGRVLLEGRAVFAASTGGIHQRSITFW